MFSVGHKRLKNRLDDEKKQMHISIKNEQFYFSTINQNNKIYRLCEMFAVIQNLKIIFNQIFNKNFLSIKHKTNYFFNFTKLFITNSYFRG